VKLPVEILNPVAVSSAALLENAATASTPSSVVTNTKTDEEQKAEDEARRWFPKWFRRFFGWSLVVVLGSSAVIGIHQWQEKKRIPVK
jgi:hypothetical protein